MRSIDKVVVTVAVAVLVGSVAAVPAASQDQRQNRERVTRVSTSATTG